MAPLRPKRPASARLASPPPARDGGSSSGGILEEAPTLAIDPEKRQHLSQQHMEERKQSEQRARVALASQMQAEVEERLAATEGRRAVAAREEHAVAEAGWRVKEAEWEQKVASLEAAQSALVERLAASEARMREAADAASRRDELAAGERERLLALHARALEESAAANAALRRENARHVVQEQIYLEEVHRAEHESHLNWMESDEIRNAMGMAVGELVPLRQEVLVQRDQLTEVTRAAAQLKNAKEADQASFMIAKKATAKILRNKHMKALDSAVKQNRDALAAVEKEREADAQRVSETISNELASAEQQHAAKMRKQAEEAEARRRETQEALRKQLAGESAVRMQHVQSEYDRNMEVERRAAAAKLVQTSTKMRQDYKLSTEEQVAERDALAAKTLQQYANDAQKRIVELTAKADGLETEVTRAGRELSFAHAALSVAMEQMEETMHDAKEGWDAAERKVAATEEERDAHRRRSEGLAAELANCKAGHQATLERLSAASNTEKATLLAEAALHDQTAEALHMARTKVVDLEDELSGLRLAHQTLLCVLNAPLHPPAPSCTLLHPPAPSCTLLYVPIPPCTACGHVAAFSSYRSW